MRNKITLLVFVFISSINMMQSQKLEETKADKEYNKFAYVEAIKTYERIIEKGYVSQEMLQKLGDSYYFKGDLVNAEKWYAKLFGFTKDDAPEYYFRYAQTLKAIKDYKKADEMLAKFNERNGNDLRAKLAVSQKDYLAQIKKNSGRFTIENAGDVNSKYSDYGSAFYKDKIVFASARDTSRFKGGKNSWTGEGYTNLYDANVDAAGELVTPERFGGNLNSKFHESTPVFTKDLKTVYFTRNNFLGGKKGEDSKKSILLKLYKATLKDDKWIDIQDLPFNSNEYSVAHPALSADDKTLYFASDMPGTLGQSDLFKVAINDNGSYGKPINLGNVINTEGRETFPMITPSGELYFASDGHPGLGGLDVFMSKLESDGSFKEVQNVGEPLNSSYDDFGFLINESSRIGYVTSNREGGRGGDDIYNFKEIRKLECEQKISGIITDKETKIPLADVKVTLSDANFNMLRETRTDKDGKFDFGQVKCNSKYYIKTDKEEYLTMETPVITAEESGQTFVKIEIEKAVKAVTIGDDLFKAFNIKEIYFDLNKWDIRRDAEIELAKILDVLEQNPTLEMEIRAHTDSRQTFKYNQVLSDKRAKSTMDWLVSQGINKNRLKAKGYGEKELVNKCADGVQCTEEEHQANRRSEFLVIKM
ncbi:OmpA family protein [Flavobacterium sp. WC2509]|uniref:OmpA family protein n=1 Tax=Flavobacterium sp. WC2509 TaxID=3461406 RepID=UPI0040439AFB